MGQIKNIKLHIVTDIKGHVDRGVKEGETLHPVNNENQGENEENKNADRQLENINMEEKGAEENQQVDNGNTVKEGDEQIDLPSNKTITDAPTTQTCEQKYGMKCFLNQGVRLSGMIKQRHTDFIVRECDPQGNFVQLTDLSHIDDDFIKTQQPMECPLSEKESEKIKTFAES